ncbi:MAG: thiamine phosphate synthase, partial [Duncaniella sp.]|nr:thiamine phosphate synthase [Duncaniella sp.]
MELITITPPYLYRGEGEAITAMRLGGEYSRIHIRKPDATPAEISALVEEIPPALRGRLTLHDGFGIAADTGVGGLHLNRRNPAVPDGWRGLLSRSLHTVAEAAELDPRFDYAFLSPIFPSISKPGYRAEFDRSELRALLASKPNIYALGGVTRGHLTELATLGFHGAAMLGVAWGRVIDPAQFALQLITSGESPEEVIRGAREAVEGGCRWVQIRMKDATESEVARVVHELAPLRQSHGIILLVDDHVGLAARTECIDGVHVGKRDMPVAEARRLLGPSKILGATANTTADLIAAARDGADYIGLGPYRFTTTKKNLSPVLGLDGYRRILYECRADGVGLPVTAIGGILPEDVTPILATGVSGIAVSGAILHAPDPRRATEEFVTKINQSHIYN